MFNMKPNTLIWGARYDRMMDAFGGKGFYVEEPKDLSCLLNQGSARKPQRFRWHSGSAKSEHGAGLLPRRSGPVLLTTRLTATLAVVHPKDSQQPSALQSNTILLLLNCGPSNS
jgi:hypothetical protein